MELEAQRTVYTQLKVQYELLKVTLASEKPVFQVLEMAEAPEYSFHVVLVAGEVSV